MLPPPPLEELVNASWNMPSDPEREGRFLAHGGQLVGSLDASITRRLPRPRKAAAIVFVRVLSAKHDMWMQKRLLARFCEWQHWTASQQQQQQQEQAVEGGAMMKGAT